LSIDQLGRPILAEAFDDPARRQTSGKFLYAKTSDFVVTKRHVAQSGQHRISRQHCCQAPVRIPKAESAALDAALREIVKAGSLWLTSGPASVLGEEIPAGVLTEDAVVQAPPPPVGVYDLLPERLPGAWEGQATTALGLALALSKSTGKTLPWPTVRGAIEGALRVGLVELAVDSGAWPCDYGTAQTVRLRLKTGVEMPPPPPPPPAGQLSAEADLTAAQVQDLADVIGEVASVVAGHRWAVRVRFELGGEKRPPEDVVEKVADILRGVSKDLNLE